MKRKRNSSFCRNSYTRKKMKATLTKKDDGSIVIETQFESTEPDKQTNIRPTLKSIISSEAFKCLLCVVRSLLLIYISGIC